MTNLTYFKALIKGREKIRSVGVYHFFFVDYKIIKNKFCRKIKEKKELLLYMELSTHLMLKMSGMSTKILHVHE